MKTFEPNQELIAQMIEVFGIENVKELKISKFEFAMNIVKLMHEMCNVEFNVAFDLMFGKGSFEEFNTTVFDILKDIAK